LNRVTDGLPVITLLGLGSSANLSGLAKAERLARLPANLELVSTGMHLGADYFPREI